MYKNTITHYAAKILVDVMFYGGILCLFAVPWLSTRLSFLLNREDSSFAYYITAIILFSSGAGAVYILFNLKQMFQTLLSNNPFVEKNIRCFRRMAVACALIAAIYTVKCFLLFSYATVVIVLVFSVGTLVCLTLKDIFKQAVYYKDEHDWTV